MSHTIPYDSPRWLFAVSLKAQAGELGEAHLSTQGNKTWAYNPADDMIESYPELRHVETIYLVRKDGKYYSWTKLWPAPKGSIGRKYAR